MKRIRYFHRITAGPHADGSDPPPSYEGPLDLVPGAFAAYSLRALSEAFLGENVVKLRRSSDDAELDFACDAVTGEFPTADAVAWRDAAGAANAFIVTWYDQSGNARNAVQATEALQPLFIASGVGGKSVLMISDPDTSTPRYLATASSASFSPGAASMFCVGNPEPFFISAFFGQNFFTGPEYITVNNTSGNAFKIDINDGAGNTITASTAGGAIPDAYTIFSSQWNTTAAAVQINNATVAVTSYAHDGGALSAINQKFAVANDDSEFFPDADYFYGPYAELIVYESVISGGNVSSVNANIADYYGIMLP